MGILQVAYSIEIIDIRSIRKQRARPSPVDAALGLPGCLCCLHHAGEHPHIRGLCGNII